MWVSNDKSATIWVRNEMSASKWEQRYERNDDVVPHTYIQIFAIAKTESLKQIQLGVIYTPFSSMFIFKNEVIIRVGIIQ